MTIKFVVSADEPDTKNLEIFFANLDLIFKHQDLILHTPEYYDIHIRGTGCFALYMPTFPLLLGDLLRLWAETEWRQDDKYFYCITGSPLSGRNSSKYWSRAEGLGCESTAVFSRQLSAAVCLLQTGSPIRREDALPLDLPQRKASDWDIERLVESLNDLSFGC